ncbi:hypothetical protein ACTXT7_007026 [Hymenolepis weldensis]
MSSESVIFASADEIIGINNISVSYPVIYENSNSAQYISTSLEGKLYALSKTTLPPHSKRRYVDFMPKTPNPHPPPPTVICHLSLKNFSRHLTPNVLPDLEL